MPEELFSTLLTHCVQGTLLPPETETAVCDLRCVCVCGGGGGGGGIVSLSQILLYMFVSC